MVDAAARRVEVRVHVQGRLQVRSHRYVHSRYNRYDRYTDLHAQLRDPRSAQGRLETGARTQDAGSRWGALYG